MKILKYLFTFPLVMSMFVCVMFPVMLVNTSANSTNEEDNIIVVGQNDTTSININHPSYKSNNPFYPKFNGQCTWFAWSRANQLLGVKLPTRDAKYWAELARQMGFKVGYTPSKNSVMVQTGSLYGHVAYVEGWDGENITISEGNSNWVGYMPVDGVGLYASDELALEHIKVSTSNYRTYVNNLAIQGRQIAGFIYLE